MSLSEIQEAACSRGFIISPVVTATVYYGDESCYWLLLYLVLCIETVVYCSVWLSPLYQPVLHYYY
jgi:hypothetical protein